MKPASQMRCCRKRDELPAKITARTREGQGVTKPQLQRPQYKEKAAAVSTILNKGAPVGQLGELKPCRRQEIAAGLQQLARMPEL